MTTFLNFLYSECSSINAFVGEVEKCAWNSSTCSPSRKQEGKQTNPSSPMKQYCLGSRPLSMYCFFMFEFSHAIQSCVKPEDFTDNNVNLHDASQPASTTIPKHCFLFLYEAIAGPTSILVGCLVFYKPNHQLPSHCSSPRSLKIFFIKFESKLYLLINRIQTLPQKIFRMKKARA
jgi:hypothetical protein